MGLLVLLYKKIALKVSTFFQTRLVLGLICFFYIKTSIFRLREKPIYLYKNSIKPAMKNHEIPALRASIRGFSAPDGGVAA